MSFIIPIGGGMLACVLVPAIVQNAMEVGKEILVASGLSDEAQFAIFCLFLFVGNFALRIIIYRWRPRHDGAQGVYEVPYTRGVEMCLMFNPGPPLLHLVMCLTFNPGPLCGNLWCRAWRSTRGPFDGLCGVVLDVQPGVKICIIYYTFFYSIKNLRLYSNCKLLLDW